MTSQWETVRVFISSTFEDMHAERDYLVKQVFPELREWCEKRKLNLVDIDLRWGVKEDDSQNKNVVDVCLKRIDDARPFFLCFLGQRRGWVPQLTDISETTISPDAFPDLREQIGNASVTEMEIMHALINPFHRSRVNKDIESEYFQPVKHAFFYLRNPSYLSELPKDFPDLLNIYTNEGIANQEEKRDADLELEKWRTEKIPDLCEQLGIPLHHYKSTWNANAVSPELLLPLACPSLIPENQNRWKTRWTEAGIDVEDFQIVDSDQIENAQKYNQKRIFGRLSNFETDGFSLKQTILEDLKKSISLRFPIHQESENLTDLQVEIDQQEQFFQVCQEGFISRGDDFKELNEYINDDRKHVFILTAPGGFGKSTLLANWISQLRSQKRENSTETLHYRFIGQSDQSTNVNSLLSFLLREIKETTKKLTEQIPTSPTKLRQELPKILSSIGQKGKTIIILDAINQLENGLTDLSWLPWQLPENIKLIISMKSQEKAAEDLLTRLEKQVSRFEISPFQSLEDRQKLVKTYLSQYLKDLDEHYIQALIQTEGANNPLFLKVALSELRVFGAFSNIGEKIRSDFGTTPISAFNGVLKRLEDDPVYSSLNPKIAVPLLFGLIAHTRAGLSANELSQLLIQSIGIAENEQTVTDINDSVFLFLRQVRPFIVHREGRFDFFYESFKLAVLQRYDKLFSFAERHRKLASYFKQLPVWQDAQKQLPHLRKISELPYHLAMGNETQSYVECLTNFDFLHAKIIGFGVTALLDDFKFAALPELGLELQTSEGLGILERAISLSMQNLQQDQDLLAGQLIARLGDNTHPILKNLLEQTEKWTTKPWIMPLTHHFNKPISDLQISYRVSETFIIEVLPIPNGKEIIVLSQEGSSPPLIVLKRIELLSGKVIHQISLENGITHVKAILSPNGKKALLNTGNKLLVYNTETLLLKNSFPIQGEKYGANSLFFRISPDEQYVFVCEQNKITQIRLHSGISIREIENKRAIQDFKFSASGNLAAYCLGGDRTYDASGNLNKEDYYRGNSYDQLFVLDVHGTNPAKLVSNSAISDQFVFNHDETHLICINEVGKVETWDVTNKKLVSTIQVLSDQQVQGVLQVFRYSGPNHQGVAKIVQDANKNKAICSFGSSYMAILNISDPENIIVENNLYHPSQVMELKLAFDNIAVSLSPTKELLVWNMQTGKMVSRFKDNSLMRNFWTTRVNNKEIIISKNDENFLRIWEISNLSAPTKDQFSIPSVENNIVLGLKKHPKEVSICVQKIMNIHFWGIPSKKTMFELKMVSPILSDMHFHPDGNRMILVFVDGTIKIISLENYQILKTINPQASKNAPQSNILSTDGNWLLWGEKSNALRMINLENNETYDFEVSTSLQETQIPPVSDVISIMQNTPTGKPGWGRTNLGIISSKGQVYSFCYIPHLYKPNPAREATLEYTSGWTEIHDLYTGKLVQKINESTTSTAVIKIEVSQSNNSIIRLIAKKETESWNPSFLYTLEKFNPDLNEHITITNRSIPIIDFSVNGDATLTALLTQDGRLEILSMDNGDVVACFRGDFNFTKCAIVDDGRTVCTGDEQGNINFFKVENLFPVNNFSTKNNDNDFPLIASDWQFSMKNGLLEKPEVVEQLPDLHDEIKEKKPESLFSKLFKKN